MTTKLFNSLKAVAVFCCVLFSIIACEKDFENIGVGLVDNNLFNTAHKDFNVVANTINIEKSQVSTLPLRNLGILKDDDFGKLSASLITQLGIPSTTNFGLNPVIDAVILDIPYFSTKNSENNSNNTVSFKLDSVFGNQDAEYKLNVSRLGTFLNTLDPIDPTKRKVYYSNDSYTVTDLLYSGSFKPNRLDTVLYVSRSFFSGKESVDTIMKDDKKPSIKLPLDKDKIKNIFITNATSDDYSSVENFTNYFRGIKITPEEIGDNGGSLMTLNTSGSTVKIYYTNEVLTDETDTDLNGDGDKDDKNVPVKTKQTATITFSGIISSTYDREYTGYTIENAFNTTSTDGQEIVYLQGSAGSRVEIDLFATENLQQLRDKNWLINGAILDIYVSKASSVGLPSKLYLYKDDYNSVIKDVITEAQNIGIGGDLIKGSDGKPEKYRFSITDYVSDILKTEDAINPSKLVLREFYNTDTPQTVTDTIVKDLSWKVKGVALHGNKVTGLTSEANKMKLKIYYTKNSNQ